MTNAWYHYKEFKLNAGKFELFMNLEEVEKSFIIDSKPSEKQGPPDNHQFSISIEKCNYSWGVKT